MVWIEHIYIGVPMNKRPITYEYLKYSHEV